MSDLEELPEFEPELLFDDMFPDPRRSELAKKERRCMKEEGRFARPFEASTSRVGRGGV